jgi:Holliday junction resolvasome RuvABC endonuclease subunit
VTLLSIDPGTRYCGFCWWEHDTPTAWLTERATSYEAMVERVIARLRLVDVVAIEGAYISDVNKHSGLVLAYFVGAVRGLCIDRGIPCHMATTAEIDTRCGISTGIPREERKLISLAYAQRELGNEIDTHIADAYLVGVWARGQGTLAAWAAGSEE